MSNPKILTFLDASVLIYAAVKPTAETFARRMRAMQVLSDPDREFVASEFLRLEVLPIAHYFQKPREIAFYEKFFAAVTQWVAPATLLAPAYALACQHGLGALDALHVAAAQTDLPRLRQYLFNLLKTKAIYGECRQNGKAFAWLKSIRDGTTPGRPVYSVNFGGVWRGGHQD